MKIDAIIFDKDGTLIDFDSFWISVSLLAISDMKKELSCENIPTEEFMSALGVEDGVADIDGILCHGTYEQMGEVFCEVLEAHGITPTCDMTQLVLDTYRRNASSGEVRPTCENLVSVLEKLKNMGKRLFVVTTDNREITEMCLEKLGVRSFFERVYADDGTSPPKPDPFCAYEISGLTSVPCERILMVGDTMTDVRFAKNAGIKMAAVGASEQSRQRLSAYADITLPDVSYVPGIIEE